jgi:7,8-dihydropterin-6-yl-methyl-4-(beta-D-ribofuranosyl)aminobenzene 5'-phosphate synthase
MAARVTLEPVDIADVTIVMDNSIDQLMAGSPRTHRASMDWDWFEHEQLRAEHGFSLLLSVNRDGQHNTILYDCGLSRDGVAHNLDVLGLSMGDVRTVVLSHGHADHHGGLEGLFSRIGQRRMPLVLHPDAWKERKVVFPTGVETRLPPPSHNDLDREGWQVLEERGPSLLLQDTVLITGQVDRVTEFERGFPLQYELTAHGYEPDPWIWEDQAVVVHVRGKGLVVLSGCGHAGVVNILRYARALTGVEHVHAFIGGMHLTGGIFEPIIPQTIQEVAAIRPDVLVPGHCTGWRAIHQLAAHLPDAYLPANVGTRYRFAADDMPPPDPAQQEGHARHGGEPARGMRNGSRRWQRQAGGGPAWKLHATASSLDTTATARAS